MAKYEADRKHPFRLPELKGGVTPRGIIADPMSYEPYMRAYMGIKERLMAGYPIPDDVLVSVIGNRRLLEATFRLRDHDKIPMRGVPNPGKSAHIAHTEDVRIACLTMLGRAAKREDSLFTVPSGEFQEIGFSALYAPTTVHLLHTRIVPHRLGSEGDIPEEARIRLVDLLQRHQVIEPLKQRGRQRFS